MTAGPNSAPLARRDPLSGLLILAGAPMLAAGLGMPAISITRLAFFGDTYSILDGILRFAAEGDWFLFLLLIAFSVLFPAAKIAVAGWAWLARGAEPQAVRRLLGLLATASRWSMLDVFVVALTVLVADGRLLASADVHIGIVLFAGAAVLSTLAAHRVEREARARVRAA